ncbi:MAG: hypothetical protein Q7J07_06335, partial [Pelolinea sp.]|nr:hypothetical protein [Pelolinea sp.]
RWEKAILITLSHPSMNNSDFQLGLSNLVHLDKKRIISALENYHCELEQKNHQLFKKQECQSDHLPWNVSAMFDLSLAQINTELKWVKNFIETIKRRKGV